MEPGQDTLRVCFTGKNTAGSWIIRGEQIAGQRDHWEAINHTRFSNKDIDRFDVFCFVKRPIPGLMEKLIRKRKVVVFDIVDSWGQPADSLGIESISQAQKYFQERWEKWPVHSFIFPNKTMRRDLDHLVPHSTTIYHHYFPKLKPVKIKEKIETIGYEGNIRYIEGWVPQIEKIAKKMGAKFVLNPESIESIDIGIAARSNPYDNLLERRYKSNVKLANLYGAGVPALMSANDFSYHETDCGEVRFFNSVEQLEEQLEDLSRFELRNQISEKFIQMRDHFCIEKIASYYEQYFQNVYNRIN
jgi:hypothetical protein